MKQLFCPQPVDEKLIASEIHVWYASLEMPESRFEKSLSLDERVRAERYHFQDDANRFIVRRGILRTLLGRYLNVEPGQIEFCYGKNGKPGLAYQSGRAEIYFNLSHAEDMALYVFTRDCETGVDIEYVKDVPELERIVELYFTTGEMDIFQALPESEKREAFFHHWTRKEAIVKTIGEGLSWPMDKLDVSIAPAGDTGLQKREGETKVASRWSIRDLETAPGFSAAVAAEGLIGRVICRQWPDQA